MAKSCLANISALKNWWLSFEEGKGINIEGSLKLIKSTIVPAPALHIAKLALASISSIFIKKSFKMIGDLIFLNFSSCFFIKFLEHWNINLAFIIFSLSIILIRFVAKFDTNSDPWLPPEIKIVKLLSEFLLLMLLLKH